MIGILVPEHMSKRDEAPLQFNYTVTPDRLYSERRAVTGYATFSNPIEQQNKKKTYQKIIEHPSPLKQQMRMKKTQRNNSSHTEIIITNNIVNYTTNQSNSNNFNKPSKSYK